jgi:hypothetical protein
MSCGICVDNGIVSYVAKAIPIERVINIGNIRIGLDPTVKIIFPICPPINQRATKQQPLKGVSLFQGRR